ncbi:CUB and zona pellucida-like domain-containing protein 1 [Gigantopelta aegis]|uniref:CUB and zona pellucida-like domain-containing protein 1 n=1 Tax=Gigantopelta aegis TaxID=1735272 RepID=UPI001B887EDB|nr:CUB and zona pellucida-like domain-containing protein 1 [Gigantopelta aegis]
MTISFNRGKFPGLHEQYMTLRDSTCHATGNQTHITLVSPLSGCGTTSRKVGNNTIYENVVKSQEVVVEGVISRVRELSVPFECVVPVVTNHFAVEAQGVFDIRLELFHDEHFNKTPEDPFYITPGESLYVQLNMETDTRLSPFAMMCDATPVRSRSSNIYPIIQHGCAKDDSVRFLPNPSHNVQRFSMEAFKYIDNSPAVYLHCDVIVCNGSDNSSRCASGCLTTNPGRRAVRDVARAAMSGGF